VGKPQVFADTPRSLAKGVMVYGFGRRLPRWTQFAVAMQVRLPLVRRLLVELRQEPPPVCGWPVWRAIQNEVARRNGPPAIEWIHFRSQWNKKRSSMLGLNRDRTPRLFAVVEPQSKRDLRSRLRSTPSFRITACTDSFSYERWSVRQYEPLPRLHRPAHWDPHRIRRVADDVANALDGLIARPAGTPAHWRPMHGDFVPWNLREDSSGQFWLLDWEDAGWGPPLADIVRYVVAYHSLRGMSPDRIAEAVRKTIGPQSRDSLFEVARFWLSHPNLQPGQPDQVVTRRKAKDSERAAREVAAFRALAVAAAADLEPRVPPHPKELETSSSGRPLS
jgi:thiamine kinase-like enzyme